MVYELKCECGNVICRDFKPNIKNMERCECGKLFNDYEDLKEGE